MTVFSSDEINYANALVKYKLTSYELVFFD